MEIIGNVYFYDRPLRRPAIVQMGYGYSDNGVMRAFSVDIDEACGTDAPDTPHKRAIIGHIEESA